VGDFPQHPACTALLVDQVELKCGCKLPVVADVCQAAMERSTMPTAQGFVNDKAVTALRDSGCSTVVVRRSLVTEEQLTGHERVCVLIDGTVRRNPTATINVDTPYLKGTVTAVCMTHPLYDLIIGNVPGVVDVTDVAQAVITRAMATKQNLPQQELTVPPPLALDVSRTDLTRCQRTDKTLAAFFDAINAGEAGPTDGSPIYFVKRDLLYRRMKDEKGREYTQLVVPTNRLRDQVMELAHASAFGGHQGINRTKLRILAQFWWPQLSADVARFCKSCDICQRTISRGRVPHVPLGNMPIIETPFDRIAIDLIGPIVPASERGHKYILTIVDYATRYPEAVALKDISTVTVAEALIDTFTRVGIPKEILSDQGSQFVSDVMKEVSRLLSIKQLVTTPYHPMCNGLVERYNGTIKTMLKRVCHEKPKEWDRYLPSVLFAYREIRQESLGYSPFELLYGRSVRGPMTILRELWTKEHLEPEVKTTYQYVLDLQTKLQETCKIAAEELRRAQGKQATQFNKKAVYRQFAAGSKVLILRPTDHNKLLMQWKGPYDVIEHVRDHNYLIRVKGRSRLYHANMLKQFIEREPRNELNDTAALSREIDESDVAVIAAAILEATGSEDSDVQTYQTLQKETWTDVDINPSLTDEQRTQVRELLREFTEIFTDVPKRCNVGEHQIHLTTIDPVHQKPYPLPFALREALSQEIDAMLELQVIEPSTSPYASPVVMVKKPDNSIRVCVDYRKLNKITVFDPEPMTTADEIFAKLANDRYFSKFDLSKGYWQIPMKTAHKPYTSFTTHRGMFQFKTMPFGLVNAPATFSRIMRQVLHAAENLDNYLDDVLAHTGEWNEQLRALRDLFTRLRAANLAIRPTKCSIGYTSVEFLGFEVGNDLLQPIARKVEKVTMAPKPTTKAQLRSFLGLIGYYRRFIPNFAAIAVPLTDMTKKSSPNTLLWDDAQDAAFNALRCYLTNPPVLHLPNFRRPFILQTDACKEGMGAVMLQEYDGIRYPVAFASRKLLPRERNYSTIEQECLAIVWAIQKFSDYLYGKEFVLETDHQPLQYLTQACFQNGRLMRWALALQPYSYTVRAIKGSQNVGADFLSRHAIGE
jgi:RNase H-like domain found in reverse transcriptase/Reverse transcriptase (RNA-dependent DNA polymerase)/Integrase zinc binding domain/Integrase core domain